MRLSTSTNILNFDLKQPYAISPEHAISVCAAAGYKYIDINICGLCRVGKKHAPMTLDDWESSVRRWRRLGDDLGVKFTQTHAYWSVDGPVAPGNVPGGELGEELMRRSVLASEILGTEYMVTHPFSVVVDGKVQPEMTYEANLEYFARWHKVWHEHGVGMAIENMTAAKNSATPSPFAAPETLIRLIDELNQPDIGIRPGRVRPPARFAPARHAYRRQQGRARRARGPLHGRYRLVCIREGAEGDRLPIRFRL